MELFGDNAFRYLLTVSTINKRASSIYRHHLVSWKNMKSVNIILGELRKILSRGLIQSMTHLDIAFPQILARLNRKTTNIFWLKKSFLSSGLFHFKTHLDIVFPEILARQLFPIHCWNLGLRTPNSCLCIKSLLMFILIKVWYQHSAQCFRRFWKSNKISFFSSDALIPRSHLSSVL